MKDPAKVLGSEYERLALLLGHATFEKEKIEEKIKQLKNEMAVLTAPRTLEIFKETPPLTDDESSK